MEIVHQTLQDFFKRIGLPMSQDTEMTVHRLEGLHGDKPMQSPLFRTNYYSFLLILGGKSEYSIDDLRFDLGENAFYFTNPGHLKSFKIEEPLRGYMLTFTEGFVQQYFVGDFFQQFPFLLNETVPVMWVDAKKKAEIEMIFEMLLNEYARLVTSFKNIISDNFKALALGKMAHILSVKEISAQLNIHPNYLTNIVKSETNKSASDWIQERTMSEAKAILGNSNRTISDIADALGFTDSTHFAKFFKKMTGNSPTDFRKKATL
jgi:AraC family transcriptional regulator, transcriptional activator of pobA